MRTDRLGGRARLRALAAAILVGVSAGGAPVLAADPSPAPVAAQAEPAVCDTDARSAVDAEAERRCSYIVQVAPDARIRGVTRDLPDAAVTHTYRAALHGFAARLNAGQVTALRRNPDVLAVTPDVVVTVADTQSNPPWGLDRVDQRSLPLSGTYVYPPQAGAGVTAYVIDTGILATHVDFGGRVAAGAGFIPDGRGSSDCNGHGTHVAGTIGGATYGVAKAVTLVPVRVLDCDGSSYASSVLDGLDWVIAHHAAGQPAVANMSLSADPPVVIPVLNAAVAHAVADGIVVAVAAGNSNANACLTSPASTPEALTVGATTNTDARASFSNYGTCLDLFAPGDKILSAYVGSNTASATASGTSMAAPHVAGIAAVAYGLRPSESASTIAAAVVADATTGVVTGGGTGSPNRLAHLPLVDPAPTAVLAAPSTPTNAATLTYGITFSEPVAGLAAADFSRAGTATGCVVGTPAGSGASYSVAVTGCSQGTVILSLRAGTVIDAGGNPGPPAAVSASPVTIDRTPPAASIAAPASPTKATTLSYGFTFSEPVAGLTASDVARTGTATSCAVGAPAGTGTSFTVAVTGCSGGTVALSLKAGSVTDAAGNAGPPAAVAAATVTIDRKAPTATLGRPASPTSAWTLGYAVAFSEPVSGLGAADFTRTGTATGCVVGAPAGSGASYSVAVTGCSEGTVALSLKANTVVDAAGNAGPPAAVTTSTVTVDRTSPRASLACTPPAGLTNAAAFSCTATFSEAPGSGSSFVAADVLVGGTATGRTASAPTGSGAGPYAFAVSGAGPDGTLSVAVKAGAIKDAAGNVTTASATLVWTIDRTKPSASAPVAGPRQGATLAGTAAPLALAWSGGDGAGSGVARYQLARSTDGGTTWTTLSSSLTTPSANVTAPTSGTVRHAVRAIDRAGNAGAWAHGPTLAPRLVQQSSKKVSYGGTWTRAESTRYSGGSTRYAKVAGRSASYTFTGRSIAFVTTRGPARGKVRIYVDGTRVATVDLYRSSAQHRAIAWQKTWPTSGTRTVRLVVAGTAGRPRVDLDAFVVLK